MLHEQFIAITLHDAGIPPLHLPIRLQRGSPRRKTILDTVPAAKIIRTFAAIKKKVGGHEKSNQKFRMGTLSKFRAT